MNTPNFQEEITQLHADICSAMADPNRILILYALAEKPYCVNDMATELGLSQPAASRHLKILRERGLVRPLRQGPSVEYSLADPRLIEALNILRAVLRDRIVYRAGLMNTETQVQTETNILPDASILENR
jgi:DNA-binding transcriptional ArsR family regulator